MSVTGKVKFFNETKGCIAVNGKFPASQTTQAWPDVNGTMHQFRRRRSGRRSPRRWAISSPQSILGRRRRRR